MAANRHAIAAVGLVLLLQLLALHVPLVAGPLGTVPLTVQEWGVVLTLAAAPAVAGQLHKAWRRGLH
jgi:hypothetical protein